MGKDLDFDDDEIFGGMSPRDKERFVENAGKVMMIGDGANDRLAFDRALVRGTPAIDRGLLETKSDFYFLGERLGGIRALLQAAEVRRSGMGWILCFAVVYNLGAIALALSGSINPLVAAVIMPLSSIVSLGLALWRASKV